MTDHGPRVIIAGTREDWPGGVRTLIPREPTREPNGTLWFGAEIRPTVKQHLAAIRMLGDWLVASQVLPVNPAAAVHGPKHVVYEYELLCRLREVLPAEVKVNRCGGPGLCGLQAVLRVDDGVGFRIRDSVARGHLCH